MLVSRTVFSVTSDSQSFPTWRRNSSAETRPQAALHHMWGAQEWRAGRFVTKPGPRQGSGWRRGAKVAEKVLSDLHQFHSAFAAVPALAQLVLQFGVVGQVAPSRALDGGDVDEDVFAAVIRCDEPKSFGGVEPFNSAAWHDPASSLLVSRPHALRRCDARMRAAHGQKDGGIRCELKVGDAGGGVRA